MKLAAFARAALLLAGLLVPRAADAVSDAIDGYAKVKPALLRIWAVDGAGHYNLGTGIVVSSDHASSIVLTATHVVAGATSIALDVNENVNSIPAERLFVGSGTQSELTILRAKRGDLPTATFSSRALREGETVAIAGFPGAAYAMQLTERGFPQRPDLQLPRTISDLDESDRVIGLANLDIQEGMSGSALFDPASGDIIGLVDSRLEGSHAGFALSARELIHAFLLAHNIGTPAVGTPGVFLAVAPTASPPPPMAATPAAPLPRRQPTVPPPSVAPTPRPPAPPSPEPASAIVPPTVLAFGSPVPSGAAQIQAQVGQLLSTNQDVAALELASRTGADSPAIEQSFMTYYRSRAARLLASGDYSVPIVLFLDASTRMEPLSKALAARLAGAAYDTRDRRFPGSPFQARQIRDRVLQLAPETSAANVVAFLIDAEELNDVAAARQHVAFVERLLDNGSLPPADRGPTLRVVGNFLLYDDNDPRAALSHYERALAEQNSPLDRGLTLARLAVARLRLNQGAAAHAVVQQLYREEPNFDRYYRGDFWRYYRDRAREIPDRANARASLEREAAAILPYSRRTAVSLTTEMQSFTSGNESEQLHQRIAIRARILQIDDQNANANQWAAWIDRYSLGDERDACIRLWQARAHQTDSSGIDFALLYKELAKRPCEQAMPQRFLTGPGPSIPSTRSSTSEPWYEYPFPGVAWRRDGCEQPSPEQGQFYAKFYNDYRVPISFEFGVRAAQLGDNDPIVWHGRIRLRRRRNVDVLSALGSRAALPAAISRFIRNIEFGAAK